MTKYKTSLRLALAALALASSAAHAVDYTVPTPTAAPYYKTDTLIQGVGAFSDTFSFDVLADDSSSFIWVLPYSGPGLSVLWHDTTSVELKLFDAGNLVTPIGIGQTAAQLGINLYADPATAAYALFLASQGFNPAKSLFWSGSLDAGSYKATVSGVAGGILSPAFGGGGAYIAKFSIPPVPEPSSMALAVAGLGAIGLILRRRPGG